MAAPPNAKIILMPFLQRWDGKNLQIRCALLPQGSPIVPLEGNNGPTFATANLQMEIHVVPAASLPEPGGSPYVTLPAAAVSTAAKIFSDMSSSIDIDPTPAKAKKPAGSLVSKYLPISYQEAVGYTPSDSNLFYTDNSYKCTMRHRPADSTLVKKLTPSKPGWGHLIAMLLKDPVLCLASGVVREFTIPVADPKIFDGGAFLYCTVASVGDGTALVADPNGLKIYATHVPSLAADTPRPVFSPVLFPVLPKPPNLDYSEIFAEVENYDDGWAKAVHCGQIQGFDPFEESNTSRRPIKEAGVRLGWDDEQVTIWANRGIDSTQPTWDSPVGVAGYRVDARLKGTTDWTSLVAASGDVVIGTQDLGTHHAELSIPVHPSQLEAQMQGQFWLPMYYANWYGPAILRGDALQHKLSGMPPTPGIWAGDDVGVNLVYGKTYEFRVRFSDISGGGPKPEELQLTPGPALVGSIDFRRYIPPTAPRLETKMPVNPDSVNPPTALTVQRPLLQYPAVSCIGKYPDVVNSLIADIPVAAAEKREPALPDLDVFQLQLVVQALEFPQDPAATDSGYVTLFTTTRDFPADPEGKLNISLKWVDVADVHAMAPDMGSGDLVLPTARTVRIEMRPLCKPYQDQPNYYGGDDVMIGPAVTTKDMRKHAGSEADLWGPLLPSEQFSGYFMQPDSGDVAMSNADALLRFATALKLQLSGSTIHASQRSRIVFGSCSALSKTIGPDGASVTFSNKAALTHRWLMVVSAIVQRDWTWNGFATPALTVQRDGTTVGTINVPFSLSEDAVTGDTADALKVARSYTKVMFFDLIDPQPDPAALPEEINPVYTFTPAFRGSPASAPPLTYKIRLPITTRPIQAPKIVSAGIAMSPYSRSKNYSSTAIRQRCLWLEFDRPLRDTRDAWFARMLRNVPDLLVFPDLNIPVEDPLPPLPIDAELIRQIVPGQAADENGLAAMTELIPADDSAVHFMLPLPVDADSALLFGFWTYEFRAGHAKGSDPATALWSTAQGRFGPALVVNGLQHPAPTMPCKVTRLPSGISVTAPHAVGVVDNTAYSSRLTSIWFLLYAQAAQVDGADFRNVLILRLKEKPDRGKGTAVTSQIWGNQVFPSQSVNAALTSLGFSVKARLSVMAVEMAYAQTPFPDPLGADLGKQRILRSSNLIPVGPSC
ncbi:hypothetical protein QBC43DRAFT_349594 [Cladorrhinum sp. PSN259]|nr:hypothetical protein QBC43DRAFT_349594 [Cladorrhinum sp. PSN259]